MNLLKFLFTLIIAFYFTSCSTLKLSPAEFGWAIESVLKVDTDGFVKDDRYSISFNVKAMFFEETKDSLSYMDKSIRLIRNNEGFYFMTSPNFKNVYVFTVIQNAFELKEKFLITESGLKKPAFNQRLPFIELIDGEKTYKLTSKGIDGGLK